MKEPDKFQQSIYKCMQIICGNMSYANNKYDVKKQLDELQTLWQHWKGYDFLEDHKLLTIILFFYVYHLDRFEKDYKLAVYTLPVFRTIKDQLMAAVGRDIDWQQVYQLLTMIRSNVVSLDQVVAEYPQLDEFHKMQQRFQIF